MDYNYNPIDFIPIKKKSYYEYHLPIDQMWGILDVDLCDGSIINDTSEIFKYYEALGITCGWLGTDSLLYATLIELLLKDKNNFIIGSGLKEMNQSDTSLECYWNCTLEQTSKNHPNLCKKFGFLSRTEYDNKLCNSIPKDSLAYKASYDTYQYLKINNKHSNQFLKTYASEMSIWSFFVGVHDESKFKELIQDDTYRPTTNNFLEVCDMCITLQVGEDNYWQSYILIQSKHDIISEVKILETQVKDYIESFEFLVKKFKNKFKNEIHQEFFIKELLELKQNYI